MNKSIVIGTLLFLCLITFMFSQEKIENSLGLFEQPLLITSAGQSAEVQLASVLAKRAGLEYTLAKTATSEDLAGQKTIALVVGASLKGLGAAGLDTSQEKERVKTLISAAAEQEIPILCLHLGGEARRGALSDEFIQEFLPYAKMVIAVKSGNQDKLFTKICKEKDILLVEVEKTVHALDPLKKAFKKDST
jgi:hypothetical protein